MGRAQTAKAPPAIFDARGWVSAQEVAEQIVSAPCVTGVFGGRWSLVDLYSALTRELGPCDVDVITWVAAFSSLEELHLWLRSQRVRALRLVVDPMTVQRARLDLAKVEEMFGRECLRVIRTHAKGAVLRPLDGSPAVLVQSSANLNKNSRLESFFAIRSEEACGFWSGVVDEIFDAAPPGVVGFSGKEEWAASRAVLGETTLATSARMDPMDRILKGF
jgi:hypothetical protein